MNTPAPILRWPADFDTPHSFASEPPRMWFERCLSEHERREREDMLQRMRQGSLRQPPSCFAALGDA